MLTRSLLVVLAAPLLLSPPTSSCRDTEVAQPPRLSRSEFGRLVNELSEEGERVFESCLLEVQRSLDYVEHQLGQSPASTLVIAPQDAANESPPAR